MRESIENVIFSYLHDNDSDSLSTGLFSLVDRHQGHDAKVAGLIPPGSIMYKISYLIMYKISYLYLIMYKHSYLYMIMY